MFNLFLSNFLATPIELSSDIQVINSFWLNPWPLLYSPLLPDLFPIPSSLVLDWTELPPLPVEPEEAEMDDTDAKGKLRNPSGPKSHNPYESDETSAMLPIFVAIGAFIPLVFCMCKLWKALSSGITISPSEKWPAISLKNLLHLRVKASSRGSKCVNSFVWISQPFECVSSFSLSCPRCLESNGGKNLWLALPFAQIDSQWESLRTKLVINTVGNELERILRRSRHSLLPQSIITSFCEHLMSFFVCGQNILVSSHLHCWAYLNVQTTEREHSNCKAMQPLGDEAVCCGHFEQWNLVSS